jgi:putative SbcD/Mre11-related phosphoesterase
MIYEVLCGVSLSLGGIGFTNLSPVIPYPALLIQYNSEKTLIIGDLHIGWEASLAEQGVHIPSQTPVLLEQLKKITEKTDPTRIIILGDIKHDVAKVGLTEWRDVPLFFDNLLKLRRETLIVPGNHDGNLEALVPREVRILPVSGTAIDSEVGVIHGHAWPDPSILGCNNIVMAHLHPVIILTDALGFSTTHQVWLRVNAEGEALARGLLRHMGVSVKGDARSEMKQRFNVNPSDPRCIFVPSFNSRLAGQTINRGMRDARSGSQYLGPILRSGSLHVEEGDVYLLDGSHLGKLGLLRRLT